EQLLAEARTHDAQAVVDRMLQVAHGARDRALEAEANISLGRVLTSLGKPDLAVRHLTYALDILRHVGDSAKEGRALIVMSCLYLDVGATDNARACLEKAEAMNVTAEAPFTRGRLLFFLAGVELAYEQFSLAL